MKNYVKRDVNSCTLVEIYQKHCLVSTKKSIVQPSVGEPAVLDAGAAGARTAVIVTLEEGSSAATEKRTHQNTARLHC